MKDDLLAATVERAEEAERLEDLDSAFRLWLEISSKTQKAEAHFQLARLALMLERWKTAETALLHVLDTGTNLSVAEAMLGALFLNRSDGDHVSNLETAKMWFLRSIATAKIAPTLCLLGVVYSNLKEKESAAKAWRSAIEVDENYEEAYFNLGLLLSADGQAVEAEGLLRKAVQLDPDSPRAHGALGVLLEELGHYAEAEAELKRTLELNPSDSIAQKRLRRLMNDPGRK
jgi:tetratricopeptide (TPR) repeat protein